jgi:hypothetical protein
VKRTALLIALVGLGCGTGASTTPDSASTAPDELPVPTTPPTATDLQGGWFAVADVTTAPSGGGMLTNRRLRFADDRYVSVSNSSSLYCVETGSFQINEGMISFQREGSAGDPRCPPGASRTENIKWIAVNELSIGSLGGLSYGRMRNVPKLFVTSEKHDGNFGGDASLAGATPLEKADAFCDGSVAKPDNGRYHAMMWTTATPADASAGKARLAATTTYFQADGERNVFTTDPFGWLTYHGPLIPNFEDYLYFWSGDGCSGWTSSAEDLSLLTEVNSPSAVNVSGRCNSADYGVVCVGEGEPAGGVAAEPTSGSDGGTGSTGGASAPQGSWRVVSGSASGVGSGTPYPTERLRFEGNSYVVVHDEKGSYCGETGQFELVGSRVRFLPLREEGMGYCMIGDVRTAAMILDATHLNLSFDKGSAAKFVRAAQVAKVFVTLEAHDGDFLDDPTLAGDGAVSKADAFCARSIGRPDAQPYKAALVDGSTRSASPPVDWVLSPKKTYYQASGALPMFTTDQQSQYAAELFFTNPFLTEDGEYARMWSGLDPGFTTSMETCRGWSSSAATATGGVADNRFNFFDESGSFCNARDLRLICVSQ